MVAAQMATKAVTQLTLIATTRVFIVRLLDSCLIGGEKQKEAIKGKYRSEGLPKMDTCMRHRLKRSLRRR